jgi:hypothetical protein
MGIKNFMVFDLRYGLCSSFEPGTFLIETPYNSKPWGLMQHNAFLGENTPTKNIKLFY